jgi:hypothetical protein
MVWAPPHRARRSPDHRDAPPGRTGDRRQRPQPRPWRARDLGGLTHTIKHGKGP